MEQAMGYILKLVCTLAPSTHHIFCWLAQKIRESLVSICIRGKDGYVTPFGGTIHLETMLVHC